MNETMIDSEIPRERLAHFCRVHPIRNLTFFGSVTRGDTRLDK
jgi:predicted nucleotidyltransferase